jgi:hypothetical protein
MARLPLVQQVTNAVADPYDPRSLSARARARRWDLLLRRFPDLGSMRVLDLGGMWQMWAAAPVRPQGLTLLNLCAQNSPEAWIEIVEGDACDPPAVLRHEHFDLVFSNSVMEHVGGPWRRRRFAEVVQSHGDHHWVQTPNRWFPIEPHYLFPGFQYLPVEARAAVAMRWPLGHNKTNNPRVALGGVLSSDLISARELRHYFPDSEVTFEHVLGLRKSLIAVR